jgi:broad specificity phosphatase PhoE
LAQLRRQYAAESAIVVTHGDTINAAGQLLLGENAVVYDTQECCWLVFDPTAALIESARCEVLQLA